MKRRIEISLITAAVLAFAGTAWVAAEETEPEAAESSAPEAAGEAAAPTPVYGMQAWIDEETGELRAPTAEEAARMSARLQQMFSKEKKAAPTLVTHKSGMLSVELDESMMVFSVARIEADGSLTKGCVDDPDEALEFIEAASDSAGPEEE